MLYLDSNIQIVGYVFPRFRFSTDRGLVYSIYRVHLDVFLIGAEVFLHRNEKGFFNLRNRVVTDISSVRWVKSSETSRNGKRFKKHREQRSTLTIKRQSNKREGKVS